MTATTFQNAKRDATSELSLMRLYILRATYLLIVVGLGVQMWPDILKPPPDLDNARSAVRSLLGGVSLLALIGIRHPVAMLPVLFFELIWKLLWILAFGLPRWLAGTMTPALEETMFANLMGMVIFPLAIPWRHVWVHFVVARGERWR